MIRWRMDPAEERRPWAPSSTAEAVLFVFSVGLPSAAKIQRYAGIPGVLVYLAVLGTVVALAGRFHRTERASSIPRHRANALMAATILGLALVFAVVYPRVTSGSDRDEALDLATRELLRGRFPYYVHVFATGAPPASGPGNPISPMPGELLLAAPFVLLGSGAWQTFFWLAAFFSVAGAVLASRGRALFAVWSMLLLGPAALHEIVTGGDLLANSLWVLVLGALVVAAAGGWTATVAALLFGIGLSSRAHFALLVPIVFVTLGRRCGWRTATARCAIAIGTFVAVTLPFYLHDPAAFSPLHVLGKLGALDRGVPYEVLVASVVGSGTGAAVLMWRGATSDGAVLATSATVLGVPVLVAIVLAVVRDGLAGFEAYGWYAISSMPFGVVGAMALRTVAPRSIAQTRVDQARP